MPQNYQVPGNYLSHIKMRPWKKLSWTEHMFVCMRSEFGSENHMVSQILPGTILEHY